jgi:hypothetical protein
MSTPETAVDVVYRGSHDGPAGAGAVTFEATDGSASGVLRHVVRHSPTGFSWGYSGSGPADLARSLLIAALGDDALCPGCYGARYIVWVEEDEPARPYHPAPNEDPDAAANVYRCSYCDDGYRHLPYQAFKFAFVAGWGDSWEIRRSEILRWLKERSS